ncbi:MAG TPA: ATP-dependent DNA helicase RecG [Chthoniobacterales bacterium]|nr:ATP-dependent DNA helicase RecG [Chthoniobacterales bacterium]
MEISQPLEQLDWIPRPKILALRRLGITTAEDLLTHFPRRHEDRHQFAQFPREESETPMCLSGQVIKTSFRRFGGRRIFEATLQEPNATALSQPLVLRWFNLYYIQKMIAADQQLVVYGKPKLRGRRICMDHPEFEIIEDDADKSIHLRRITPIYPATEGLSQRVLRSIIYRLLQELDTSPMEPLLPKNLQNGDRAKAIRAIHFPETWESLGAARDHLVLSEFFAMQMLIASRRTEAHGRVSAVHSGRGELMEKFLHSLPFELTAAQKKVIAEIRRDMESKFPMNRLLQGDVGSGKTVVAIASILLAVEAGYQAAFMAPTQILAEQHYAVLRRWLEPLGVKLSIRTAARQEESGPLPLFEPVREPDSARVSGGLGSARVPRVGDGVTPSRASQDTDSVGAAREDESQFPREPETHTRDACATRMPAGEPDVIIGTHALLYEKVSFSNLGLVVIDEQHKFGVAQRARLTSREPAPDVLVMTATPIPRTITMTVYGDLDVSILDEMPRGRGKIITAVRDSNKLGEVLSFMRKELEVGRQLYVVYPLIEESEKLEAKAAAAEFERWRERLHPHACELLHGRIPGPEKQGIMERFRRGEARVLISTTVIEVGVDVPNATVMLIENAERFGLAQLHQLRGRIGRGEHKSYCILLTSGPSSEAAEKLAVLEKTTDGFEVAEADWELRGPGDLLGTAQSGLPALKIGDLRRDAQLMKRARTSAMSIFEMDPNLEWPENQRFRRLIVEQQGRTFSNVS